jgi:hypothetical protein
VPHFTKMAASQYDITPIEMAHASLIGQPVHILSPLVASTYLLVSMLDVNSGDVLFSAAFRSFWRASVVSASKPRPDKIYSPLFRRRTRPPSLELRASFRVGSRG